MKGHAEIFVDIEAHIESGKFIRQTSTNKHDIRDFTLSDVDLSGCKDILDLGCSYGFFTRGLAGRLHSDAHILGIDLWPQCEKYFRNAYRESGFTGEFCCSDKVFCKRYPDKYFDFVLCSYALYFFPEALEDIARVLRPDGIFITVTHTVPHMRELVDIVKMLLEKRVGYPVHSLPLENLFDSFSSANGLQMLSPWFKDIREKQFENALEINKDSLPGLINYLCFKKPKFIPMTCGLEYEFIKSDVAEYLHELLTRQDCLTISKNDTVFICQYPLKK
jgi:SAM-dependent methyltransferase